MLSESFLDFIKKEKLFQRGHYLLLAISGGLDSVVLAHLLKQNEFQFALAHMNFQLRGEDSKKDEDFVRNLAEQLEVGIFTKNVQINKEAGSTQIQARELRYAWFDELMENNGFDMLLTAHHANDLLETALFNLSRGTGIKGLRSILPLQNKMARPLLFAEKSTLKQFAMENSIQWREDISNASDHYTRNKIRHHIVPQLESLNPNLLKGFQQTSLRLRAAEEAWAEKLDSIKEKYFYQKNETIEIDKYLLHNPHALIYLSELLTDYGFGLSQLQSFDYSRIGAQLLSTAYVLSVDREFLLLNKINKKDNISFFPKRINFNKHSLETPFGNLSFEFIDKKAVKFENNPAIAFIDYDCIKEPFEIDLWRRGDKIQPLGMKGEKKISDILIDQKVPLPEKKETMVLKSNGEIVWVIGRKFSDMYKLTTDTKIILRIEYHENS